MDERTDPPGRFHDAGGRLSDPGETDVSTPVQADGPAVGEDAQAAAGSEQLPARSGRRKASAENRTMLPGRERRRFVIERMLVRLIATAGVVGIGVLLGAILTSSKVQGWIIGLVVALVSVILSAVLWSSRQL